MDKKEEAQMKRPIKLLIAAGILAVVLVSYFIVARMNADKDGADGENDNTVTLAAPDTDSLTEISYTYQGNTVSLAKDDTGSWYYTEDRNFPLNGTRIDAMLTALSSVTATRQVSEKSDDFSEFGLAEPQCSITAKTKDGTAYVFHIGSYNEMLNAS